MTASLIAREDFKRVRPHVAQGALLDTIIGLIRAVSFYITIHINN